MTDKEAIAPVAQGEKRAWHLSACGLHSGLVCSCAYIKL